MPVSFSSAAPTPPPKTRSRKPAPTTPSNEALQKEREDGLNGLFQVGQAMCIAFGQWADAGAIALHSPNISRETAVLANKYENVAKVMDGLAQVGPFTALFAATMPLFLQIAANHKKIPVSKAGMMGVMSPDVLEGRMRLEVQQMAFEAEMQMRAQQEELNRARAEYEQMNNIEREFDKVPA